MRTLGVDLGNGKVKFASLTETEGKLSPRWASHALPYTADRQSDFEIGLMTALAAFSAIDPGPYDRIIISTSHFYSYPSFQEALQHTADLVAALWGPTSFLISVDGKLHVPARARLFKGREVLRFAATKFWGSAYLASRIVPHGLCVDVGTTSTDANAIVDGMIEPSSQIDPDGFNLQRLETQRLMWYGMTSTPLDYIAKQASTGESAYFLYPRQARTACLSRILDLVPEAIAVSHAYFGHYPSREEAFTELAQAFGLDTALLPESELIALANHLHRQLIARVAEGLEKVMAHARLGEPQYLEAVVTGIGKEALAIPALLACGVRRSRIVDLESVLGPELSAASSAYGLALRGLDDLRGKNA